MVNALAQPVIKFLSCRQNVKDRQLKGFAAMFARTCERYRSVGELMPHTHSGRQSILITDCSCPLGVDKLSLLTKAGPVIAGGTDPGTPFDKDFLTEIMQPGHVWIQRLAPNIISDSLLRFGLNKQMNPTGKLSLASLFAWGSLEWAQKAFQGWPPIRPPGWPLVSVFFDDFLNQVRSLSDKNQYSFQRIRYLSDGLSHGLIFESAPEGEEGGLIREVMSRLARQNCSPMILNLQGRAFELGYIVRTPSLSPADKQPGQNHGLVFVG